MKQAFLNWKRAVASSMVLAALIVASAGQTPAAEPKGELKSKEVKALVVNAKRPADHMKLARHYTAMADKHDAEAQEHEALAAEYTRNPQMGSSKTPMSPNSPREIAVGEIGSLDFLKSPSAPVLRGMPAECCHNRHSTAPILISPSGNIGQAALGMVAIMASVALSFL